MREFVRHTSKGMVSVWFIIPRGQRFLPKKRIVRVEEGDGGWTPGREAKKTRRGQKGHFIGVRVFTS